MIKVITVRLIHSVCTFPLLSSVLWLLSVYVVTWDFSNPLRCYTQSQFLLKTTDWIGLVLFQHKHFTEERWLLVNEAFSQEEHSRSGYNVVTDGKTVVFDPVCGVHGPDPQGLVCSF